MKGRKRGTKKLEASTDANKTDVTVQVYSCFISYLEL